jgi:hypothetical protein
MLSAAKHLSADRDRPFAEFTLSGANVLRVTLCDCLNGQALFFAIEPCQGPFLKNLPVSARTIAPLHHLAQRTPCFWAIQKL